MSDECDVDEFILFFIRSRIEYDNKYTWFNAPFIRNSAICEKCELVKAAAVLFEDRKIVKLKGLLTSLIDFNRLTYKSYCCVSSL